MLSDITIIRTRITAPRRRTDLVARQRLIDLLNELVEKRLVLVSAPAGYGKTSLLVDFASRSHLPVCWYSIDKLDFDPQRFIAYFTAAIHQRFPAFGQRTMAALSDGQGRMDVEYLATVLINDLYDNVSEHFLFVLDDYHLVNDSLQVRSFINRFIQNVEENCHLVITSRSLLSLSVLPIMAARSQVGGISFEELAFLPDEVQQLYQQNQHHTLTLDAASDIQRRTEGWVTGIVLASQVNQQGETARARLARVTGFGIDEYFLQVIDHLPGELRSFLLWSSLLEEFNAERCEAVLGPALSMDGSPWQEWMNTIQQNNLFAMPVGEQGDWLRYHPLFLDFLQSLLSREKPEESRAIENRLAIVCANNGEWDRAFAIYHRQDANDNLIQLIETAGPDVLAGGRISTMSAWLDALPVEILNTRPYIVALQGYVAMALGDTSLALTLYNQAVGAMHLPEDRVFLARTLAMRATMLRLMGKLDEAIADANESMILIGNDLDLRRIQGEVLRCIGLCHFHQGKLQEALTLLQKALDVMLSINERKNEAILNLEIGLIHENLGNYTYSKEKYLQALEYWRQVENPIWLSNLLNNLGVLHQMMGEYEEASRSFEKALEYAHDNGYARMEAFVLTGIGDIYTELQAYDQAAKAYQMASTIADRTQEHFLQVYILVQTAALAGLRGDIPRGLQIIQQARQLLQPDGSLMEKSLCDLEYAGLRILGNKSLEIIPQLEAACGYFGREGHKVQCEKAHLYLVMAYQDSDQPEKFIEHLLHILSSVDNDHPPAALLAAAARYQDRMLDWKVEYLHDSLDRFFDQVNLFLKKLPGLRKYLREHARAVPFAPPTLFIRALGKMQVQINNQAVTSSDWQTQAARDLFFMLLAHPEGMTKEEISLVFWPDASPEEIKFRFKNTVYRLRRALGKQSVILEQDIYRFNNSLDYEYDVELFLKQYALATNSKEPLQKLTHFREAVKYYRGNYLPEIMETWALTPRENLRQNFISILLQVSESYLNQSNYDLALEYCQRSLTEDNLLEDAYRLAFRIYAAQGNRAALVRQYQRCVDTLEREINAPPSPQTLALYHELLR